MPLSLPRGRSWETQSSLWEVILDDPPSYFSSPQDHISHLLRIIFLVPQSRPLHSVGMQPVLKCQMVGWSPIEKRVHYFCNTTIETFDLKTKFPFPLMFMSMGTIEWVCWFENTFLCWCWTVIVVAVIRHWKIDLTHQTPPARRWWAVQDIFAMTQLKVNTPWT